MVAHGAARTFSRRRLGIGAGALTMAGCATSSQRVVIVGGGFAGAAAVRAFTRLNPSIDVTVVEPARSFMLAPGSNLVLAGLRDPSTLTVETRGLQRHRIRVLSETVGSIDSDRGMIKTIGGTQLPYDRLIIAAGAAPRFDTIAGYSETAATALTNAWWPGEQTLLLKRRLEFMPDGGTVIVSAPEGLYRGPAAIYERASLIAHWLVQHKPKAKLLLLDPRDSFPMKDLFEDAWAERFGAMVERIGGVNHRIAKVNALTRTITTDFGETFTADVLSLIPPQRAADLTAAAGLRDPSGWCPVNHMTFESSLRPGIHVIGDSAALGSVPKTAYAAVAEGEAAAQAIVALDHGQQQPSPVLQSVVHALAAPDIGFSMKDIFKLRDGFWTLDPSEAVVSPRVADASVRRQDAIAAAASLDATVNDLWGWPS